MKLLKESILPEPKQTNTPVVSFRILLEMLQPRAQASPCMVKASPQVTEVAEAGPYVAEASPHVAEASPCLAQASPCVAHASLCMVQASPHMADMSPRVAELNGENHITNLTRIGRHRSKAVSLNQANTETAVLHTLHSSY